MAIRKSEAIILRTQPFRSSSLIVTLFTRSYGKIKVIAKGVRAERELRGSFFELFSRVEAVFNEKTRSDLYLLSEASLIESYDALRSHLNAIYYASYFVDLVDELCELYDSHEALFDLLDYQLRYLAALPTERLARLFEVRLLYEIGWMPHLGPCESCPFKVLESGHFSIRQGALFCEECPSRGEDARHLSSDAVKLLKFYLQNSLEESVKLPVQKSVEIELRSFMDAFFSDRLHKPLRSQIFLNKVRNYQNFLQKT